MPLIDFKNKITRFTIYAGLLYVSWFLLYELLIKPKTTIDEKLISVIITNARFLLNLFGFTTYRAVEEDNMQLLGIDGGHPIWVGTPCNAMTLFAFFTLFIIAFPGNIKQKLWFIPLGILIIHVANLLRVIGLTLINYYKPEYLEFNHTYTFTIFVYGIIFALWMWWVNFSLKSLKKNEPKA
ncbi:MAG TPA: archaeosortase/exosortase family protein [Bacteroidia bacterium]|jgi:exosortase family protein XrtF|nr:archaeosortase/exosortase family protein [Bacteroidia bacterium]